MSIHRTFVYNFLRFLNKTSLQFKSDQTDGAIISGRYVNNPEKHPYAHKANTLCISTFLSVMHKGVVQHFQSKVKPRPSVLEHRPYVVSARLWVVAS